MFFCKKCKAPFHSFQDWLHFLGFPFILSTNITTREGRKSFFPIVGAFIPWIRRKTSNPEASITEIPLPAPAGCTHEEAFYKIEDLKGLPFDVEKWIRLEDGEEKLKLLQRTQRIYTCRDKTEDKERVFNFGSLSSLKCSVFEICEKGQRSERDNEDSSRLFLLKPITIIKLIRSVILIKKGWYPDLA